MSVMQKVVHGGRERDREGINSLTPLNQNSSTLLELFSHFLLVFDLVQLGRGWLVLRLHSAESDRFHLRNL